MTILFHVVIIVRGLLIDFTSGWIYAIGEVEIQKDLSPSLSEKNHTALCFFFIPPKETISSSFLFA